MYIGRGQQLRYKEITLLHLIGAVMILLCHFTQKEHLYALGEVFISGVPLFLFVAGFLAALKPLPKCSIWIKRKMIRILIPLYLWILPCMLMLWLDNHESVTWTQFLLLITNMQGLNYIYWKSELHAAVLGLGQLWFTTEILLCWLLTPFFESLIAKCEEHEWNTSKWFLTMSGIILFVQPLLVGCGVQTSYIITYFLGYLISRRGIHITNRLLLQVTSGCLAITVVRFILMCSIDGSMYYDRYIALLSAAAVGIWVFFFVFWFSYRFSTFTEKLTQTSVITFFSSISFEIYITHFWFLNGKWSVANYITNQPVLSDAIVCALTVLFSYLLHIVSKWGIEMVSSKTKEST
ncbi:MAG: acyltransferase [Hespellia sp.]|nr:acyltransferase [Hespellia sp.]